MVPGRGSLAEVFPQSMKDLFAQAGVSTIDGSQVSVKWISARGPFSNGECAVAQVRMP